MENTVIVTAAVRKYEVSKETFLKIKATIKEEAKALRTLKLNFKDCQRGIHKGERISERDVAKAKHDWRHRHLFQGHVFL